jgi:outer membrane protein
LKKIVKAAGISLVILSSSFLAHSAEAAQKVGYVSTGYLMSKLPQREAIVKNLQQQNRDDQAELQKLEAKINTKIEQAKRDRELLGEEGLQKLQIEIASLQKEGQLKVNKFKKEQKEREYNAQREMGKLIQDAVTKIAETEGYDMVIDSQALQYSKPDLNLTEKVLAELK